jgi:hypothetical protein
MKNRWKPWTSRILPLVHPFYGLRDVFESCCGFRYIDGFLNYHTNWHHPTQTSEGVINPKFWIDMMIILLIFPSLRVDPPILSTNLAENPPWKQRIYKVNLLEDSCAMWNCQMV